MGDESDYLDFEISIQKSGTDSYLLRAESGNGQAESVFTIPFNEDKRALIDATLTKVALRSSAKVRSSSAPEVKKMREVGSTLFEQAITGQVREFYYKCQGQADQQGKGIRWRLSLDPSVGDLPWEFLHLQGDFLALNPRSPVVRFIKGAARVAPLKAEHPLRVLVVIASPSDETPLDTTAEKERITAALSPLTAKGLVDLALIEGPDTWERLIDALRPNRTHILHFIGHGAFDEKNNEGVLVMEDADGKGIRIDSERLRVLVQGKSRLRLVVLNSCLGTRGDEAQPFSSMAAGLVRSGVPAVIAMQFEISDDAAREIAKTFYTSLALNLPVDAALTEARRKIYFLDKNSLEWATPILYMQVPDGQLFQFNLDPNVDKPTVEPPTLDPVPKTEDFKLPLAVLVQSGTHKGISLSDDSIKIGRDRDNDIVLTEGSVSRKHATLVRKGSTYEIKNVAGSSGTWVNNKQVTKHTLKDKDALRLGNVEFDFQLVASAQGPKSTGRTRGGDESLKAKADKRYQDAEEAMVRGEWAAAATAFRGALDFVPGYQDAAHKLSICESRDKAATLYNKAQRLCAEKQYYQALQLLAEISRLDPSLVDTANVLATAECGQKFHRAIGELQARNRDRGVELLREVINSQPDFEDAAQRLDNLASGGDGLFNDRVPPSLPTPPPPPPPPAEAFEWRLYSLANPDPKALAEEIRQYFLTTGHESQVLQQGNVSVVQGQKTGWRSWVGMGLAATMKIETTSNGIKVSVGGGKWLEQGAAIAVSMLVLWPLLIAGGVGMAQQKQLIDALWRMAESFVMTRGGRQVQ